MPGVDTWSERDLVIWAAGKHWAHVAISMSFKRLQALVSFKEELQTHRTVKVYWEENWHMVASPMVVWFVISLEETWINNSQVEFQYSAEVNEVRRPLFYLWKNDLGPGIFEVPAELGHSSTDSLFLDVLQIHTFLSSLV